MWGINHIFSIDIPVDISLESKLCEKKGQHSGFVVFLIKIVQFPRKSRASVAKELDHIPFLLSTNYSNHIFMYKRGINQGFAESRGLASTGTHNN